MTPHETTDKIKQLPDGVNVWTNICDPKDGKWKTNVQAFDSTALKELIIRLEQAERNEATLGAALAFYEENARLCRLIHREGDAGRNALAADGGKIARAALASVQDGGEG